MMEEYKPALIFLAIDIGLILIMFLAHEFLF